MPARDIVVPLLVASALLAGVAAWKHAGREAPRQAVVRPVPLDTAHYTIYSYAGAEQTRRVARAVEALHDAYERVFAQQLPSAPRTARLQLVLYADRRQFKAHNRSSPWAEAFYQPPRCHAYYAQGAANPYHWMVHEATHQLNRERARLQLPRWINEGVASYFGASRLDHGVLRPGDVDPHTYPTWWLPQLWLAGRLDEDLAQGRLIPLRALITGTGPDIDANVNLYYLEYWSLAHYLFGTHARGFEALMHTDGSLADFERLIGPVDAIQRAWYAHLLTLRQSLLARQTAPATAAPAR